MTQDAQTLISEIERVAEATGKSTSTIGREVGQGGGLYARLKKGGRVWPDTAATVMARLAEMMPENERGAA